MAGYVHPAARERALMTLVRQGQNENRLLKERMRIARGFRPPRPVADIEITREEAARNQAVLRDEGRAWEKSIHARGLQVQPYVMRAIGVVA